MDPQINELKELVRQNTALTQEVHAMIKSMHRATVWKSVFKFIWIAVVVAASFGLYIYLAPYLQQMLEFYGVVQQAIEQVQQYGGQFQQFQQP